MGLSDDTTAQKIFDQKIQLVLFKAVVSSDKQFLYI